jgi:hypothetical protein
MIARCGPSGGGAGGNGCNGHGPQHWPRRHVTATVTGAGCQCGPGQGWLPTSERQDRPHRAPGRPAGAALQRKGKRPLATHFELQGVTSEPALPVALRPARGSRQVRWPSSSAVGAGTVTVGNGRSLTRSWDHYQRSDRRAAMLVCGPAPGRRARDGDVTV